MIDPHDQRKEAIERLMSDAADDKAHRDEAVWLLVNMPAHMRREDYREWFERWETWKKRQEAL